MNGKLEYYYSIDTSQLFSIRKLIQTNSNHFKWLKYFNYCLFINLIQNKWLV